jgi:hypothetical protein
MQEEDIEKTKGRTIETGFNLGKRHQCGMLDLSQKGS